MISSIQVKMARTALGWSNSDLSRSANVAPNTISRFEQGKGVQASTVLAIQRALEDAGVRFTEDHESIGLKLLKTR